MVHAQFADAVEVFDIPEQALLQADDSLDYPMSRPLVPQASKPSLEYGGLANVNQA